VEATKITFMIHNRIIRIYGTFGIFDAGPK